MDAIESDVLRRSEVSVMSVGGDVHRPSSPGGDRKNDDGDVNENKFSKIHAEQPSRNEDGAAKTKRDAGPLISLGE